MRKASINILLLIFSQFALNRPSYAQTENEKETKIFLSQIINRWNRGLAINDSNATYIEDKPDFSNIERRLFSKFTDTSDLDGIFIPDTALEKFDTKDSIEICKQIKISTNFASILRSQPNIQLISSKKIKKIFKHGPYKGWTYIHKHAKYKEGFTSISLPLFYRNYTRAIFYESDHCGPLCGSGGVYVYYRINNVWIKKGTLMGWIS